MPSQQPKQEGSSPGHDILSSTNNEVSARRLKKREIDRKCQRQARERTRSRIAYLESLVENLQQPDGDERSASLLKRLSEVEKERDVLAHTLKGVQKAVYGLEGATDKYGKNDVSEVDMNAIDFGPASLVRNSSLTDTGSPTSPVLPEAEVMASDGQRSSQQASRQLSISAKSETPAAKPSVDLPVKIQNDACDSCRDPTSTSSSRGSFWRYANVTLMENYRRISPIMPEEDALDEDIPVRVVLGSWDEVASQIELPASWKIMRRIDEHMFTKTEPKERLATMYMLHTMLQYHRDPTAERRAKLPPWYLQRPSQSKPHAYAINYFVWPGVRERFVHEQHKYCGNLFAQMFQTCLQILWPYDFRDCFMQNWETGAYEFSPNFRTAIHDISKWTMRPEFFRPFPDLRCDIPSAWTSPTSTSNAFQMQLAGHSDTGRSIRQMHASLQQQAQQIQQISRTNSDKVANGLGSGSHDVNSVPAMSMAEAWLPGTAMVGWNDNSAYSQAFMDHTLQPQWTT
ncbi:uncharacterized protein AB675_5918 [Cyphellophora attinorum]|uniref:BZIP domain-containing protein n=1 Tax=Cyphellophora attinorum TaxID=1664694 RepID=A0A0N1H2T3_9EURO|nr:uncharacterized protein AB675_5918 [Phialophora attinorum]KPI38913.1 hypothetical protein AB675_5918 [Phialophora attinorum]